MMQDYMILRKDVPRAETGVDEKVIQNFKQKMDERRVEAVSYTHLDVYKRQVCRWLSGCF